MKQKHHIHSVIVSYNRLDLFKQCYQTYKDTITLPHSLVVVDNCSDRETMDWLIHNVTEQLVLLGENKYPGFATNKGWSMMPAETTLLHRSDNDFSYLPGWCDQVTELFERSRVGQVGLRTDQEELKARWNVGGNNVIRRRLWEEGLRYDERPWGEYPPGWTEDSMLSPVVKEMGYSWTRVKQPCIVPLSREDPDDPYYVETWAVRGIKPPAKETT